GGAPHTTSTRIPMGMAATLDEVGVSYREVLARAGLPDKHLDVPGEHIPTPAYFALWDAIVETSGDHAMGIKLALAVKPDVSEPLFLAMRSSRSVGDALEVLANYKRMLSAERIDLLEENGARTLTYRWPKGDREPPQVLVDAEMAFIVEGFRRTT